MKSEWRKVRLGELCRLEKGNSPIMRTPPGPYPLVVMAEGRKTSNEYQFDTPAVCVPLVSSTGHGNAAINRIHYQTGKFALSNMFVALIPQNSAACNAEFLYWLLQTRKDEYLVPLMKGTSNVALTVSAVAGLSIPLPPLVEQQRLVAKLRQVQARVAQVGALRQQQEAEMGALLTAMFRQAVSDAPRRPLAEVAPITRRPVVVDEEAQYPELGIRSFGRGTFHKPPMIGRDLTWEKPYWLHAGDLLFSNIKAWEGAVAIVQPTDHGRVGSHRYITCVVDPAQALPEFVLFYLLTPEGIDKLSTCSPGSTDRNRTLNTKLLNRIKVPVPLLSAQRAFVDLQNRLNTLRAAHAATVAELGQLLPSLLDAAFGAE